MPAQDTPTRCRRARPLLGTLVEIEARGAGAGRAVDAGFAAVARVQRLMSRFEGDSDIGRLNAAPPGVPVTVDADTLAVLRVAAELERASGGAFRGARGEPGVGMDGPAWTIDGDAVRKHAPLQFDLGGIAKGHAVDCAIDAMLALLGPEPVLALVNAGGDMRHAGAEPVRVALRDPSAPARTALVWMLENAALASSAAGGLTPGPDASPRIHASHGAAPLPSQAGASVLASTCMLADALTKVVLLHDDPTHPLLARHGARTLLYRDGRLPPLPP